MTSYTQPHDWLAGEVVSSLFLDQMGDDIKHLKEAIDRLGTLTGANAASIGSPCVQDTSDDDRFSVITTAGHAGPVWIALGVAAPTASTYFRPAGIVTVKVTGTAPVVGDTLQTSATPGSAEVGSTNPFAEVLKVVSSTLVEARILSGGGGGSLTAHDHTSTAGQGGVLTDDEHDGYSEYTEIADPSSPASNKARLYVTDVAGVSRLRYKDSGGNLRTLAWTTEAGGGGGYLPITTLTPPTNAGFTWSNQGGATSTDVAAGIRLVAPADASNNLRLRRQALAGATFIATLGVSAIGARNVQFQHFGICVTEVATGATQLFGPWYEAGVWRFQTTNYSNLSTFSASNNVEALGFYGPLIFLQVEHTGANRIYRLSQDGTNWLDWVSTTLTDFVTPDAVGFFAASNSSSKACDILAVHWENT